MSLRSAEYGFLSDCKLLAKNDHKIGAAETQEIQLNRIKNWIIRSPSQIVVEPSKKALDSLRNHKESIAMLPFVFRNLMPNAKKN